MAIMDEEIFGPILPVLAYDSIEEVIDFIHSRPKPLALYVFGKNRRATEEILDRTTSGSACVNDLIVQVENPSVPFGGIGMSGTGNYHGHYGFKTFSHERNILNGGASERHQGILPSLQRKEAREVQAIAGVPPRDEALGDSGNRGGIGSQGTGRPRPSASGYHEDASDYKGKSPDPQGGVSFLEDKDGQGGSGHEGYRRKGRLSHR